jgi:hypothetical protein
VSLETRLRDAADDLHRSVAHFEAGSADVMVRKQRRVRLAETVAVGLVLVGVIAGTALLVSFVASSPAPPATGGFSCPPGSTPDQPGPDRPRPPGDGYMYGATTFDPGSGRVLRLTSQGAFWTFDVCTNSWASEPVPEDIAGLVGEFVYDVDSDRFIAFAVRGAGAQLPGDGGAQVWTYEPDRRVWTEKNEWAMGPVPEWSSVPGPQAVYDPVSGLVVVRESLTSAMWTYDVDTDTWTEIDQGTTLPPAAAVGRPYGEDGTDWAIDTFAQALTYDASVDRLILYDDRSTWEFDIRAGRWEEQDAAYDGSPGCGWGGPSGDEFTYDEANEVSVLFGNGTLATYDATQHTWTVLQQGQDLTSPYGEPAPIGQRRRMCFAMTYDSVNDRIVVLGGDVRNLAGGPEMNPPGSGGWGTSHEVIAYDVATGEWTTLLEPTRPAIGPHSSNPPSG